jgi:hypothetical protein
MGGAGVRGGLSSGSLRGIRDAAFDVVVAKVGQVHVRQMDVMAVQAADVADVETVSAMAEMSGAGGLEE